MLYPFWQALSKRHTGYIPLLILICFLFSEHSAFAQSDNSSQEERDVRSQQLLIRGMTQSYLGYFDKAIPIYEEALKVNPSSPTIHSALAEAYEHSGDYSTATFYARQAISLAPDQLHFHRHLAHLYIQIEDLESAKTALHALLDTFPNDTEALGDLSQILIIDNNSSEALTVLDRLIELEGPTRPSLESRLILTKSLENWDQYESTLLTLEQIAPAQLSYKQERAMFYISRNRTDDAISVLEDALDQSPNHPTLSSILRRLYQKTGQTELAEKHLNVDNARISNPDMAYERARSIYDASSNDPSAYENAQDYLRQALEISPNHLNSNTLLGILLFDAQKYSEAAIYLSKAVDLNPRDIELWSYSIEAHINSFDYSQAALIADESLLLFPGQPVLLRLAGEANILLHRDDAAIRYFQDLLNLVPQLNPDTEPDINLLHGETLVLLAFAQSRNGNSATANSSFEEALKLQPNNSVVLSTIALSYAEQGEQLSTAEKYARRALQLEPDNTLYMEILGRVLFKNNELSESEEWLFKALELATESPRVHEFVGDLLYKKGDIEQALSSWNKSLELNSSNPRLNEKLKLQSN